MLPAGWWGGTWVNSHWSWFRKMYSTSIGLSHLFLASWNRSLMLYSKPAMKMSSFQWFRTLHIIPSFLLSFLLCFYGRNNHLNQWSIMQKVGASVLTTHCDFWLKNLNSLLHLFYINQLLQIFRKDNNNNWENSRGPCCSK